MLSADGGLVLQPVIGDVDDGEVMGDVEFGEDLTVLDDLLRYLSISGILTKRIGLLSIIGRISFNSFMSFKNYILKQS